MVLSLELATAYCICFESSLIFEFFICILHLWFAIVSNTCILHLYWFHILVGRPTDGCLGCGTFEGQAASLERARSESTRISTFEFCISICILLLHLYYFHILAGRPVDGEVLILRRKCQSRKECLTLHLHLHFVIVFCICILHLYLGLYLILNSSMLAGSQMGMFEGGGASFEETRSELTRKRRDKVN